MVSRLLLAVVCLCPMIGKGQVATSLRGPVSGIVFDRDSRALRPVIGVPGSAYVGAPLVSDLDEASVGPGGSVALGLREGNLFLIRNLRSVPELVAVEGALAGIDHFAWAPDMSAAAVYASGNGQAQIIRGLGDHPRVESMFDVSSLAGPVSAFILTGSVDRLVVGVESEDDGGVFLIAANESPVPLLRTASPVSILPGGSGRDLWVADKSRNQIWQVANYETEPAAMLFADEASGISSPVGIQVTKDGKRLFAANAGSRTVEIFDIETRASVGRIELEAAPEVLASVGERSVWLLNIGIPGQQPWFVLDGGRNPAVFFVPSAKEE